MIQNAYGCLGGSKANTVVVLTIMKPSEAQTI